MTSKSRSEKWAEEYNRRHPPPKPVEPKRPTETDQDREDREEGVRCLMIGGYYDGKAISHRAHWEFHKVRGWAPPEIELQTYGRKSEGYGWAERRSDGVHLYRHYASYSGN